MDRLKERTKRLVDEVADPQGWNDHSKLLMVCRWIDYLPQRYQDRLVEALKEDVAEENRMTNIDDQPSSQRME